MALETYALGSDVKIRGVGGEMDNLAGWWGVPSKEHPLSWCPPIQFNFHLLLSLPNCNYNILKLFKPSTL